MNKRFFIFTLILGTLLMLTACSLSPKTKNNQGNQATNQTENKRMRQLDFGQPERQPDIRGIVKSIISNEVTILKIDSTGFGRGASSTQASGNNGSEIPRNATGASLGGTAGPGGGMMMAGPGGAGGRGPGEQTSETRAQMLAKLKELSTGEEKIIIPVGIRMLKIDPTQKSRTMVEATLADITADKSLTVWLSSELSDQKVAEFVLIN